MQQTDAAPCSFLLFLYPFSAPPDIRVPCKEDKLSKYDTIVVAAAAVAKNVSQAHNTTQDLFPCENAAWGWGGGDTIGSCMLNK